MGPGGGVGGVGPGGANRKEYSGNNQTQKVQEIQRCACLSAYGGEDDEGEGKERAGDQMQIWVAEQSASREKNIRQN